MASALVSVNGLRRYIVVQLYVLLLMVTFQIELICVEVFGKVTLSPMLYILSDPILACKIRDSSDIVGFSLPGAQGRQFKVGQYMDDTTSFVKDTCSLHALFQQICLFEQ